MWTDKLITRAQKNARKAPRKPVGPSELRFLPKCETPEYAVRPIKSRKKRQGRLLKDDRPGGTNRKRFAFFETRLCALRFSSREVVPSDRPPRPPVLNHRRSLRKTNTASVVDCFCVALRNTVESLIYWRDPKKSGPVFGGILLVLLALTYFSLISVVAYLSLLGLTGTISFRIYKNIVQAVQKTGDGHPFK
ncbi:hypothetical protein GEV33_003762 [Tenebrio molitor]|uniref:Reticulon-like protein n=1 Tax=Tenebrio molitor TaxID=7067 RepID=A0A8J6HQM3_TENMO|nr:hypothetical protein GEV33_003762 [Tenebrio molitor]